MLINRKVVRIVGLWAITGIGLMPGPASVAGAQATTSSASQKLMAMTDALKAAIEADDLHKARRMNLQISAEITAQLAARRLPPERELATLEGSLLSAGESERLLMLSKAARLALDIGDIQKSEKYGREILDISKSTTDWKRSVALHQGHTALGRLELRKGNVPQAKFHLLASSQVSAEATLASFGPSAILAKELLEKGERDAVLEFLQQCKRFWSHGAARLNAWIAAIERGETPAFGPNLAF